MPHAVSRRAVLAGGAALATLRAARADTPGLIATTRVIEVEGKPAKVFGLLRPDGGQGLVLDPGARFAVTLANQSGEPTIIHWHGQTPPPGQDGVTEFGNATLIDPGATREYDFAARPGTHWMHSHHGLQEQSLMAAPLIVRTRQDTAADRQEVVMLLHDFSFRDPAEILAGLTGGAGMPGMAGMGGMGAMQGHTQDHSMAMPMQMDLNDIAFDAYLANDRTLSDPAVIRTARGGEIRLRLINAATATAFWIDLGTEGRIVAVDGNEVVPLAARRFPMSQAQRVDVLLTMGSAALPVLAQREGDRARTGIILAPPGASVAKIAAQAEQKAGAVDWSLERRLRAATPLPVEPPNIRRTVILAGGMGAYDWTIDGRTWADRRPITVAEHDRVVLDIENHSMMAHPMHLHGHHFQVLALNDTPLPGAMRDTVLVPPMARVSIGFDATNPGSWLFHCHNLYHMASGMMTELAYTSLA